MSQRAKITSVEAIQAFRTKLLIYLSKARPALEEASSEVMRVRVWMEMEKRPYWMKQFLVRSQRLEEAESVLFAARLSSVGKVSAAQQGAVQKARAAVTEAEEKLRGLGRWQRDYEKSTGPLLKQLEKLDNLLALDIPNAVAYLNEAIDTLQKYADLEVPSGSINGSAPSGSETAETGVPEAGKEKA
ncbi:MAG TPA: hypothetical protein VN048_19225 [Verrucomicrobiae bacterium]|jgi:hypothetical protein|nr:hypothetical protein [Verrucomicrobiae bacterium]